MAWLRLHDSVLDNPKVQGLKAELFRAWVNVLCVAKRTGGILPIMRDIAFALRTTEAKAKAIIAALIQARLIDDRGNGELVPHDWDDHQYVSDSSTQRVQRFREKKRNGAETFHATDETRVSETPPLTETDSEQSRAEKKEGAQERAPRATRLTLDALPDEWKAYCVENHPGLSPEAMWHEFHDYWKARGGEKARKADWLATWRTWLRRAEDFKHGKQKSDSPSRGQLMAAALLEVGERVGGDAELHERPGIPRR